MHYQAGLRLFQHLGDLQRQAACLRSLGDLAAELSDRERARSCYEDALAIWRQIGDSTREASYLHRLKALAL